MVITMYDLSGLASPFSVIDNNDIFDTEFDGLKTVAATHRDKDLMFVRYVLCHEGPNKNGDYFFRSELEKAEKTPQHKPINWEHNLPIIGVVTDSVLRKPVPDAKDSRWYIECAGVIWKYFFPQFAAEIKAKAESGILGNSMECYFSDYVYVLGSEDKIVKRHDAPHLQGYIGKEYEGVPVYRGLLNILFGGSGVVRNPGDEDAIFLSVAKDIKESSVAVDMGMDRVSLVYFPLKVDERGYVYAATEGGCIQEKMETKTKEVKSMDKDHTQAAEEEVLDQDIELKDQDEQEDSEASETESTEEASETEDEDAKEEASEESESQEEDESEASEVDPDSCDKDCTPENCDCKKEGESEAAEVSSTEEEAALLARIAELEGMLATLEAQHAAFVEQVEAERRERSKDELADKRINDLLGAGLSFSKETLAKVRSKVREQSEEDFLSLKELLIEARHAGSYASSQDEEVEIQEVEEEAVEEQEEVNEDVSTATAGVNLENKKEPKIDKYARLAVSFFGPRAISTKL